MNEKISAKGAFHLKVYKGGVLIEDIIQDNLIVNVGRQSLARLLGEALTGKRVTQIGFGTAATPVAGTQTALENPFFKVLDGVSYAGTTVSFPYTLDESENNGVTIREFGLFSNDNTMFSRIVRNPIAKTSDIRLEGVWSITF
jgi:hypothetical protein